MNIQEDDSAAQRAGELSVPFAATLFHRVTAATAQDANVFVSPYSVWTALALTLQGAQGDTAAQLKKAIGYETDYDPLNLHHDVVSLFQAVRCACALLFILPS
jgi:serpin B